MCSAGRTNRASAMRMTGESGVGKGKERLGRTLRFGACSSSFLQGEMLFTAGVAMCREKSRFELEAWGMPSWSQRLKGRVLGAPQH